MASLVKSTSYVVSDDSWLGSAHGTDSTESITLDVSAFTSGTHYPNGFLLSGLPLGKITASGKYGPYTASPNEQQTLTFDATGGTYTLSFDGTTAAAATYANTSGDTATLTALLETFPGIAPGDVTVTRGTPAGAVTVFTIEFTGNLAGVNVPQLTNTDSLTGGSGTLTHATTVAGGGAGSDGSQTLVGFLFRAVTVPDTSDTSIDCAGALLTHGKVVSANLPVSVDAAGQADVAGRIRFV